jgi:hypothetical protein
LQIRVDVRVHSGSHLTAKDSRMSLRGRKYSSDPFVSLAIGGQSRKTKVVKKRNEKEIMHASADFLYQGWFGV